MEKSKNNDEERKIRNVEGTVDGEENVGTKRRNSSTMSETMDAQNKRERGNERDSEGVKQDEGGGRVMVPIEYEKEGAIRTRKRKKSNYNDGSNYDARHLRPTKRRNTGRLGMYGIVYKRTVCKRTQLEHATTRPTHPRLQRRRHPELRRSVKRDG